MQLEISVRCLVIFNLERDQVYSYIDGWEIRQVKRECAIV